MFIGARRYNSRVITATKAAGRDQAVAEGEEMLSHGILFHNVVEFLCDAIETITAGQELEGRGRLRREA